MTTKHRLCRRVALTGAAVLAGCAFAMPAAASAASAAYVGLGDSYSAGEGLPPYESGTDTSTDTCHRSSQAYGSLLAEDLGLSSNGLPVAGAFDFAACSGAVTNDILSQNYQNTSEPAQVSHLGAATTLVTMTIGGNDLGFSNFISACLDYAPLGVSSGEPGVWGCTSSNAVLVNDTQMALNALEGIGPTDYLRSLTPISSGSNVGTPITTSSGAEVPIHSLVSVLTAIHAAAPNAHLYLAGYPHVFGASKADYSWETSSGGSGYECDPDGNGFTMDYNDGQFINHLADSWDAFEKSTVASLAAQGIKITYVDPTPTFAGHGNCDTLSVDSWGDTVFAQKWINWTSPTITGSFHPDAAGHASGYQPAFLSAGF